MRQGGPTNNRRPRGRHQGSNNGGNGGGGGGGNPHANQMNSNRPHSVSSLRHKTFDSNGPDVRVRGNAWQVFEKYQQLARDATSAGDRVSAENYQQHAEHYYRIIEVINDASTAEQRQQQGGMQPQFGQQPDVPANYYTPDGKLDPQMQGGQPAQQDTTPNQQPEQAEVQKRNPQPSPFFSNEDMDDAGNSGPEPLVARG